MELGYLCLCLGYQGKFRKIDDKQPLYDFIDNLYEHIIDQQGEFSRQLFFNGGLKKTWHWNLISPPGWLTLVVAAVMLPTLYFYYEQPLENASRPLLQAIQNMVKPSE